MKKHSLNNILSAAVDGSPPTRDEILYLLSLHDAASIERVMAAARRLRDRYFENKLFLYGFIYLSTYCRNHCAFCFYRRTNMKSPRYRKNPEEVENIARGLAHSGVHLVDLTLGEDPMMHDMDDFHMLRETVFRVKQATDLPVMISPGVVPLKTLYELAHIKTDWYALYQETHNPELFKKIRIGQGFHERNEKRGVAQRAGMLVEDGMLLGIGETVQDRADAIWTMRQNQVNQARAMSLVPQPQTPLQHMAGPSKAVECLCIAVMRLTMSDRSIPASLDIEGIKGLKMRLNAGANVVTSIIPPNNRLAGVSQSALDIEQGLRTVNEVKNVINAMGLEMAAQETYESWMAGQKARSPVGIDPPDFAEMN